MMGLLVHAVKGGSRLLRRGHDDLDQLQDRGKTLEVRAGVGVRRVGLLLPFPPGHDDREVRGAVGAMRVTEHTLQGDQAVAGNHRRYLLSLASWARAAC